VCNPIRYSYPSTHARETGTEHIMTIKNVGDRDQVLAALRDARADLVSKRAELCLWLDLLTMSVNDIDRDIKRAEHRARQVTAIRFDVTRREPS
jgi:hypothetical protein